MRNIAYTGSLVIKNCQLSQTNSGIKIPRIVLIPFKTDDEVSCLQNMGMLLQ